MEFSEFTNDLVEIAEEPVLWVTVDTLEDQSDRTLLWGYTVERYSHHVFIKDGELRMVVYGSNVEEPFVMKRGSIPVLEIVPNKRLYPDACDLEFCNRLLEMRVNPPFTTFRFDRPASKFHGKTFDEHFGGQLDIAP